MIASFDWESLTNAQCALGVAPFAVLLACIAILPLAAGHWWEKNRNKAIVSILLGLPVLVFLGLKHEHHALQETALDYAAFIALLSSLYIITGGILLRGELAGTPLINTAILAIGAVIANLVGTTGASMLLIRPLLRANARRRNVSHIYVFFIFIVSNMGGCLTPLGDPPLYLGFLKGVPFEWTLRLWQPWLFMVGALLVVFNVLDQYRFAKEDVATPGSLIEDVQPKTPFGLDGKVNLLLLLGIVGTILACGHFIKHDVPGFHRPFTDVESKLTQTALMALLAFISLKATDLRLRVKNGFNYGPIIEVAVVFAGIFAAMIPALHILNARGAEMGVTQPWQYFLATGSLSSFLDNAPTYLTFLSVAQGAGLSPEIVGVPHVILAAISLGAVFMGANTYIGNGPNFMVRSIVESTGVKMPNFFSYIGWAAIFLWPLFAAAAFMFLR